MRRLEDAPYPRVMLSGEHRVDSCATANSLTKPSGSFAQEGKKNVEINKHERKRGGKCFPKRWKQFGGLNPAGLSHVILYDLFPVSAFEKHG